MGKASRDKGARNERATVNLLRELGVEAVRVPLSGAVSHFPGDVVATIGGKRLRVECKVRAGGFVSLYGWLVNNDALVVRADRREPLIVLPLTRFVELTEGRP